MKLKKNVAWLLSFVLVVLAIVSGLFPQKAEASSGTVTLSICIGEGSNAPENYGVDYQILDAQGNTVAGENCNGYVQGGQTVSWALSELDESYRFKFRVMSAGMGIRLAGADVTEEGWDEGKEIPVTEIVNMNGGNLAFELFDRFSGGGEEPGPGPEPGPFSDFDGTAIFVWRGNNDAICSHVISGLENSRQEIINGTDVHIFFEVVKIPVSGVTDDGSGEQYQISNRDCCWCWSSVAEELDNFNSYSELYERIDSDEEYRRTYAIDPTGAKDGASTVCTNGDRCFRAEIYDDAAYVGVEFSANEDDYTYFPGFWDPAFFQNEVDISGTDKSNYVTYETFLTEPSLHFGVAKDSITTFDSVTPLDVPDGAVTVQGDSKKGFDVTFASDFFDNVVFEIATAQGNYYMEIVRTAMEVHDNFGPDTADEDRQVIATLYYDESESYEDYEVYATVYNSDGTKELLKAEVSEITMLPDGSPAPEGMYSLEGGKGLRLSEFAIPVSFSFMGGQIEGVTGIAFNVVHAGALSGDSFGGSFAGSGVGVYYDMLTRSTDYTMEGGVSQ